MGDGPRCSDQKDCAEPGGNEHIFPGTHAVAEDMHGERLYDLSGLVGIGSTEHDFSDSGHRVGDRINLGQHLQLGGHGIDREHDDSHLALREASLSSSGFRRSRSHHFGK